MNTAVVILLSVVLLAAALRLWITASRLDRLHVRTEAAWSALEAALARRIVATRAAAAAGAFPDADTAELRRLTRRADGADRAHRAEAENELSRALATQPLVAEPALAAEVLDAGERVALARSFYNDAVRDTRALRSGWFTRLFRLAGRAVLPAYFEVAEQPVPAGQQSAERAQRTAARVLLIDSDERVLLFSGMNATGRRIWFSTGGGTEAGEDLRTAAVRELCEETGLQLPPEQLIGPIWRRFANFVFTGVAYHQTEFYFVAAAPAGFKVQTTGFTQLESDSITGYRWWSVEDLEQTPDTIFPVQLAARFHEVLAVLGSPGGSRYSGGRSGIRSEVLLTKAKALHPSAGGRGPALRLPGAPGSSTRTMTGRHAAADPPPGILPPVITGPVITGPVMPGPVMPGPVMPGQVLPVIPVAEQDVAEIR